MDSKKKKKKKSVTTTSTGQCPNSQSFVNEI